MTNFHNKWREFLAEAKKDAKILRNINIDHLKKEVPKNPDEEVRDYFVRLQKMEADPEELNPVFPSEMVSWVESLPDNYFPNNNRKMFAKWLANSVYFEETDGTHAPGFGAQFEDLSIYNNDVRYISDYINAANDLPKDLWNLGFYQVHDLATQWHHQLAAGLVGKDELTSGKLKYVGKKVVYKFSNGYSIVEVDPTAGERDYTKEEGLKCGWAHDYEELQEFQEYYDAKDVDEHDRPEFKIRSAINDLDIEGCAMGHCVGGYCDVVSSGEIIVYSLRSPGNKPHATIDVGASNNKVYQIKGRQNDPPIEKYRPMIKQWLQASELDHKDSPDYFNILSIEELKNLFFTGQLKLTQGIDLARDTDDLDIINFIIAKLNDEIPDQYWSHSQKQQYIYGLSRNRNLTEAHRIQLLKANLKSAVLGRQVASVMGIRTETYSPVKGVDAQSLATQAWAELGEEIKKEPLKDEKFFYMHAFMRGPETPLSIKEEIIDHLISEKLMGNLLSLNKIPLDSMAKPYGQAMHEYVKGANPDENKVLKIYKMQSAGPFSSLIQAGAGRVNSVISSSKGMSGELVEEILDDIEQGRHYSMSENDRMPLILNKKVSDPDKIKLLNVKSLSGESIAFWTSRIGPQGVYWSLAGKSYSRQLKSAADEGLLSLDFTKYLVDKGYFNPVFAEKLRGQIVRSTGKSPKFDQAKGEEREQILRDIRQLAKEWLNNPREIPPWAKNQLQEEIDKFFRKKLMTKDKFYDTIKEELNIKEEKGRSRQRGIYKFHCMISYSLTVESEKARGLDDILADLRALPNVTIVTVAIRNKKIGERRYIAGLAIKFIPSVPGEFNAPEDVKARIIKDVKRLSNVESMFKVSTGLQRLE